MDSRYISAYSLEDPEERFLPIASNCYGYVFFLLDREMVKDPPKKIFFGEPLNRSFDLIPDKYWNQWMEIVDFGEGDLPEFSKMIIPVRFDKKYPGSDPRTIVLC